MFTDCRNSDLVLGCLSPGLVKIIHPSSATCTGQTGYCSGRQHHTLLYIFPFITLLAKEDTVAPEEMCPAGKSITSQDYSKNLPKKEMWALSDPRTVFSGIVKEIVSEAEAPANSKNIRTMSMRKMAESQVSPRRWCKQVWDHLISW